MGIKGFTEADLTTARTALMELISGEKAVQVTIGGQTVIYHHPRNLEKLIDYIVDDINSTAGAFNKVSFVRPV